MSIRPVAIYLPQFHPIPENDEWWGKGFTEWTNVSKALPLFKEHYQPHLPADLGFYDLRLAEVREAQAQMAKAHGIYGFCYYHYWFNGRRILERPFQEVIESGQPDFPFMLCWANENWTRAWDGGESQLLLEQHYSEEDDLLHINALIPYFKDKRYIRVNDKPVVAIYRSGLLPDVAKTIQVWRNEAAKHQLELYICRFESFGVAGASYLKEGFDAAIDFQPLGNTLHLYNQELIQQKHAALSFRVKNFYYRTVIKRLSEKKYRSFRSTSKKKATGNRINYQSFVNFLQRLPLADYKQFPCVCPMWDNSARRKKNPVIFYNSTPETYKQWLEHTVKNFRPFGEGEDLLFINAWNEWAEGNHLEPCLKWGRAYLDVTKEVLAKYKDK